MSLQHEDFMALFDDWAPHYDDTVFNHAEGFEDYDRVLAAVVGAVMAEPGATVVDVGAGTGNLSRALLASGYRPVAVEPSRGMRAEAQRKLPGVPVLDGHFLAIPVADDMAAAVVSSYAFHHLDDPAKAVAAAHMLRVVRPGGRVVIADIAFADAAARAAFRQRLLARGKLDLVREMDEEYYTTIGVQAAAFHRLGCTVHHRQLNDWVWLLVAHKPAR